MADIWVMCQLAISKLATLNAWDATGCSSRRHGHDCVWQMTRQSKQSCWLGVLRKSPVCVGKPLVVVVWIITQSFLYITLHLEHNEEWKSFQNVQCISEIKICMNLMKNTEEDMQHLMPCLYQKTFCSDLRPFKLFICGRANKHFLRPFKTCRNPE